MKKIHIITILLLAALVIPAAFGSSAGSSAAFGPETRALAQIIETGTPTNTPTEPQPTATDTSTATPTEALPTASPTLPQPTATGTPTSTPTTPPLPTNTPLPTATLTQAPPPTAQPTPTNRPTNTPVPSQPPDTAPPTVAWILPVTEGQRLDVYAGQSIRLEVTAGDNVAVARVIFMRWDPTSMKYVTISEDTSSPYRATVSADALSLAWNQVYAASVDKAGNQSPWKTIWLYKVGSGVQADLPLRFFMPLVRR